LKKLINWRRTSLCAKYYKDKTYSYIQKDI